MRFSGWRRQKMHRLVAVLSLGLLPFFAKADPLPPLTSNQLADWSAVGRVNGAGVGLLTGCTGTLIAPDLVLTAAHCTGKKWTIPIKRHFIAGWNRGEYVAHRLSQEVIVHPAYSQAQGALKFQYDLALLRLEEPIAPATVTPLAVAAIGATLPPQTALIGYHNTRPHVLNGRFDCAPRNQGNAALYWIGCEVIGGNSGGPVLVRQGGEWVVAAVLVARKGEEGHALAVPVNDWVLEHWSAAILRADQVASEQQQ